MTRKLLIAIAAGLMATVLLTPTGGTNPIPAECSSLLGFSVPCGQIFSVGAGVLIVFIVGIALVVLGRRQHG
jgi:hypothetical protein